MTQLVYKNSVALLFTTHALSINEKYMMLLKKVMTGQVTKMKIIGDMVDKINQ